MKFQHQLQLILNKVEKNSRNGSLKNASSFFFYRVKNTREMLKKIEITEK